MTSPLVYLTVILVLGMIAQWVSWRLKLPSILLLLLFGFAAGQFYLRPGAVISQDLLFPVISLSVAVILCEGGLSLRLRELREAGTPVFRLCSLGAVVSGLTTAVLAHYIVGLDWPVALLLGAILVVTGPTVIAPLLRTINPTKRIKSIVKWEGIVIDPIGATMAVLVFQGVSASSASNAVAEVCWALFLTLAVGIGFGVLAGIVVTWLLSKHLIPDFMHGVFLLVCVAALFTGSDVIQKESGLLTVTIFGIYLANQRKISVKHIITFKENLRILLISTLFIVLSGRIEWNQLTELGWNALVFPLLLIFLVRPLSVILATIKTTIPRNDRIFLSFLAPRGIVAAAVSSVFALELVHAAKHHPELATLASQAELLVPLTFVAIVGTVTFCALAAAPLARFLKLAHPRGSGVLFFGASPWTVEVAKALKDEGQAVLLVDTNQDNIRKARLAGLQSLRGNILSESVEEDIELTGIGNLLATTPNDEVNSMAVHEFTHHFGSAHVFQLRPRVEDEGIERDRPPEHFRGRSAFSGAPSSTKMEELFRNGFTVKKTELTEQFSIEDFHRVHGEDSLILFTIRSEGDLDVFVEDSEHRWKPGQKLIALIPPENGGKNEP